MSISVAVEVFGVCIASHPGAVHLGSFYDRGGFFSYECTFVSCSREGLEATTLVTLSMIDLDDLSLHLRKMHQDRLLRFFHDTTV